MTGQLISRLRRWWYLLTIGMYRGECAVDLRDHRGCCVLGSGRPLAIGVYTRYRIWWQRKAG